GGFGQGEHDHLEGNHHRKDDQQVHALGQDVVNACQIPAAHGAAQQDQKDAGDGDDQAVQEAGQEVHLDDAVDVVAQTGEVLSGGQGKDGGCGEGALHLQAVDEDQDNGI